jgi:hypothetical protein
VFSQIKALPVSARVALALMVCWATYVAGTKPEPPPSAARISQLVMALSAGGVIDPSGVLGQAVQLAAVQAFNAETDAIVSNANAVVAAAMEDYAALTNQIAQRDFSVAYLGYDFPRADPPETTNHNITATIERVSASGYTNRLSAWVYFSSQPATNVTLYLQASVADGSWVDLVALTNTFPATEAVGSLDCYRYDFEIPSAMTGIPFKPAYDVLFGGPLPEQYLRVPDTGVIVSTNGVDLAPYTGWDAACAAPFTNLAVRYVGGIAVEATLHGTNYTGRMAQEVSL